MTFYKNQIQMKKILNKIDEIVLLVVWKLQDEAYGVSIRKMILELTDENWAIGTIYDSLDRLNRLKYINSKVAPPTAKRGGRSKTYYKITKRGIDTLINNKRVEQNIWNSLPESFVEIKIKEI